MENNSERRGGICLAALAVIAVLAIVLAAVLMTRSLGRSRERNDAAYDAAHDTAPTSAADAGVPPSVLSESDTTDTAGASSDGGVFSAGTTTANGETVFAFTPEQLAARCNELYAEGGHTRAFFPPVAEWVCFEGEASPCLGRAGNQYRFSADETVWSLPKLTVSAPSPGGNARELLLEFDDHSMQFSMYDEFEEMALLVLSAVLPELSSEQLGQLYDEVCAHAYAHYVGPGRFWPPDRLWISGGTAVYSCYGAGTVNLHVVPLSPAEVDVLRSGGAAVETI